MWVWGQVQRRGVGLPAILILLSLVIVLGLASAAGISQLHHRADYGLAQTRAGYAAEAGIARALLELSLDPEYAPGTFTLPDGDPKTPKFKDKTLGCEVEIVNNFSGAAPKPTPDGGTVQPGNVWLRSKGKVNGQFFNSNRSQAKAVLTRPQVVADFGLNQRLGQIDLGPGVTLRSYLPAGEVDPKPPAAFTNNVKIRTNEEGLKMGAGAVINGQVETPSADTKVTGTVTGGVVVKPLGPPVYKFNEPVAFQSIPRAPKITNVLDLAPGQPYGRIEILKDGQLTLHGGEYYLQKLVMGKNAKLVVKDASFANPVVVYVGRWFWFGENSEVNWDGAPRLLQLYCCDDGERDGVDNQIIGRNARISAIIAGKEPNVRFDQGAQLYGAANLMMTTFKSGVEIIYDESLTNVVLEGKTEWVMTKVEK